MVSHTEIEKFIKQLAARRTRLTKTIHDLKKASGGKRIDALRTARFLDAAKTMTEHDSSLDLERLRLLAACQTDVRRAFMKMASDIQEICVRREWVIDGEWPAFYVQRGIEIVIDEKKDTVNIGGNALPGSSLQEIEQALELHVSELFPGKHSSADFINLLAQAYDHATNRKGGQAPILEVYRWVVILCQSKRFWRDARSDRFVQVNADQFRARFSHALQGRTTSTSDGRKLRVFPPIDPKDAIFMYQPSERRFGFVGRIEFSNVP